MQRSFRQTSENIESKGLTTRKASSLADLHRRRKETQSQFYTPAWVAKGIWRSVSPAIDKKASKGRSVSIADTSCGNGRLFEGAPLEGNSLYGLDVDKRCIAGLNADAVSNDIDATFVEGSLADLSIDYIDVGVTNPPFSIHLESPHLFHYDTNSFGKFGAGTAAVSHVYALSQLINGCSIVAAVLPVSIDSLARSFPRLHSIVYLPQDTFINEGANVKTAVYFFNNQDCEAVSTFSVKEGEQWPKLNLTIDPYHRRPEFKIKTVDESKPTILIPVTHNTSVEMHHHNRKIVLKFKCGLTQSKVLNGIYSVEATSKRLPKTIKYAGEGTLLLDVLLQQPNPEDQLSILASRINALGGRTVVTPTLQNFYAKLVRKHKRAIEPMYRVAKIPCDNGLKIKAIKRCLLDSKDFSSPSIKKGEILEAHINNGEYVITHKDYTVTLRRDNMMQRFEVLSSSNDSSNDYKWQTVHEGLNAKFPELACNHAKRINSQGINWLADFQKFSLTEALISPYGFIAGWEQGSGKARYSIALSLMHSGRSLIVVESGLLPEMILEFEKLDISNDLWEVLKPGDMPTKKISVTTYQTLRSGKRISYEIDAIHRGSVVTKQISKIVRTNGQKWKRLFNTVLCDEGGLLANANTQQTKAVKSLCAKKLILLDGTPQRNYPKDLLPLAAASAGNGMAHQPYGIKGKPYIKPELIQSCSQSQRGEDAFFDNHIVVEWVTNEFKEDLQAGGKREVPKINNLGLFREWLSPNIQRRLRCEPDLAIFNNCPAPIRHYKNVGWDEEHLAHYLKVAVEFAHWYKQNKGNSKALNMVTILARISAVLSAANSPHVVRDSNPYSYSPLTSKQRFAIERIQHYVAEGRKTIIYVSSPKVANRLYAELKSIGIDGVIYTGEQNKDIRAKALNDEFRYGDKQVLISTWVGQRGLNLEQASAVLMYERNFSATKEEQAIYRTQRPSQTEQVDVEYFHLEGGIDTYCAQIVEWKLKAAQAGLDFGDQPDDSEEFLHLDTILSRFCDDILDMSPHAAKDLLCA